MDQLSIRVKHTDLDTNFPIDLIQPLQNFGKDQNKYYSYLAKFESMSMNDTLLKIKGAFDNSDFGELKDQSGVIATSGG